MTYSKRMRHRRVAGAVAAAALVLAIAASSATAATSWDGGNDGPMGQWSEAQPTIAFTASAFNQIDVMQLCVAGNAATTRLRVTEWSGQEMGVSSEETTPPTLPNDPFGFNPSLQTYTFDPPLSVVGNAAYTVDVENTAGHSLVVHTLGPANPLDADEPWFRFGHTVGDTDIDPFDPTRTIATPTCPAQTSA